MLLTAASVRHRRFSYVDLTCGIYRQESITCTFTQNSELLSLLNHTDWMGWFVERLYCTVYFTCTVAEIQFWEHLFVLVVKGLPCISWDAAPLCDMVRKNTAQLTTTACPALGQFPFSPTFCICGFCGGFLFLISVTF